MENPKIRFKGFTKDWEQRKLSELLEKYEDPVETPHDGYERVGIRSHAKGTFHSFVEPGKELDTAKMYRVAADKFILNITFAWEHAVAITDNNDAGKLVSHRFPQFSFNPKLKPHFFKYLMLDKKFREHLELSSPGGAGRNRVLKISDMLKYEIKLPSIEEQIKIGEYFDSLDYLITLHQRKCEQTKKLKKYMLQKMFPQNGAKVPEIRFDGFTYDWEQRKLIDVCDYVDYRGKTPTKTDSGVFLVTAKNVKDGYIDYGVSQEYISEDDYEEVMHRGKPEIGDVLITTEAPCGNVAQVNRADIALAQRIIKYRGQSNIVDNTYLKYYLLSPEFQNILNAKSSGGTVKGIKGSILHQQEIKYPKYEEQFKIGSYFNNLDHLITLHQRKCNELKKMKKYMLQNMFI